MITLWHLTASTRGGTAVARDTTHF